MYVYDEINRETGKKKKIKKGFLFIYFRLNANNWYFFYERQMT